MNRWLPTAVLVVSAILLAFGLWPFLECIVDRMGCHAYEERLTGALLAGIGLGGGAFVAWLKA